MLEQISFNAGLVIIATLTVLAIIGAFIFVKCRCGGCDGFTLRTKVAGNYRVRTCSCGYETPIRSLYPHEERRKSLSLEPTRTVGEDHMVPARTVRGSESLRNGSE